MNGAPGALGKFHRLLQELPGHHRGAAEAVADALRVGGQEAIAGAVVDAVAGDEQQHRVGLLGLLQQVDGIEDVAGGRRVLGAAPLISTRLTTLACAGPSRCSAASDQGARRRPRSAGRSWRCRLAAGVAELRILVDADGQDVERAALVEVAFALMVEREGLGLVADGVAERDADVVAALGQRHVEACSPGLEAASADIGRDLVDLAAVDLHADDLDRIAHRLDVDLDRRRVRRAGSPGAGETMRNFGTGRASRSASLKVVPGDSRTACSAEARMMAFSTISGRFRCVRSWSAPT